jgi:hypothetical protein
LGQFPSEVDSNLTQGLQPVKPFSSIVSDLKLQVGLDPLKVGFTGLWKTTHLAIGGRMRVEKTNFSPCLECKNFFRCFANATQ